MIDDIITLDYGSGGRKTSALIDEIILPAFANEALGALGDGAILDGSLAFPRTALSSRRWNSPAGI